MSIVESTQAVKPFDFESSPISDPQAKFFVYMLGFCYSTKTDESDFELIQKIGEAFAQSVKISGKDVSYSKEDLDSLGKELAERLTVIGTDDKDKRIETIIDSTLFQKMVEDVEETDFHEFYEMDLLPGFIESFKEGHSSEQIEPNSKLESWLVKALDATTDVGAVQPFPLDVFKQFRALRDSFSYGTAAVLSIQDNEDDDDETTTNRFVYIARMGETSYDMNKLIVALQHDDDSLLETDAPKLLEKILEFDAEHQENVKKMLLEQFEEQKSCMEKMPCQIL